MFELDHAGEHSGWLCAVMEYNPMREFGMAGDAWLADDAGRTITGQMRNAPLVRAALLRTFTEVTLSLTALARPAAGASGSVAGWRPLAGEPDRAANRFERREDLSEQFGGPELRCTTDHGDRDA